MKHFLQLGRERVPRRRGRDVRTGVQFVATKLALRTLYGGPGDVLTVLSDRSTKVDRWRYWLCLNETTGVVGCHQLCSAEWYTRLPVKQGAP